MIIEEGGKDEKKERHTGDSLLDARTMGTGLFPSFWFCFAAAFLLAMLFFSLLGRHNHNSPVTTDTARLDAPSNTVSLPCYCKDNTTNPPPSPFSTTIVN